jgi:hypothetical protein
VNWKLVSTDDVVSRYGVLQDHIGVTAAPGALLLDNLQEWIPFPSRAVRADDGFESPAKFEQALYKHDSYLFVYSPCSPMLKGTSNASEVRRAERGQLVAKRQNPHFDSR